MVQHPPFEKPTQHPQNPRDHTGQSPVANRVLMQKRDQPPLNDHPPVGTNGDSRGATPRTSTPPAATHRACHCPHPQRESAQNLPTQTLENATVPEVFDPTPSDASGYPWYAPQTRHSHKPVATAHPDHLAHRLQPYNTPLAHPPETPAPLAHSPDARSAHQHHPSTTRQTGKMPRQIQPHRKLAR